MHIVDIVIPALLGHTVEVRQRVLEGVLAEAARLPSLWRVERYGKGGDTTVLISCASGSDAARIRATNARLVQEARRHVRW